MILKNQKYKAVDVLSKPFQWYHSHADPIWPDDTFKNRIKRRNTLDIYSSESTVKSEISVPVLTFKAIESRFIYNLNTQLLNKNHISFSALSSKMNKRLL